jgi:hypothetical protein
MMPPDVIGKPKQLADLAQQNTDRDAVEEADQDWLGQKIRHGAQPEITCQDAEQAAQKR